MQQEAEVVDSLAAHLASLPAAEAEKQFSELGGVMFNVPTNLDQTTILAALKQVADSTRELAKVLASSSEDEYEAWLKYTTELQASNPLAKDFLLPYDSIVNKARQSEVNRAMVVAGLAVAESGPEALAAHPDPASGQPFSYTETTDGFELRSTYQFNDKPMTMRFK